MEPINRILVAMPDNMRARMLTRICNIVFTLAYMEVHPTAEAAMMSLNHQAADLVIMDLDFPDADGLGMLGGIRQRCRSLVIVSSRRDDWTMMELRKARFDAFFDPHGEDPDLLQEMLPQIVLGCGYLSHSVRERLLGRSTSVLATILSATELRVLRRIADGCTDTEAAADLHMSERTVETHRHNIRRKLGVSSTAKLVLEAARLGVLPLRSRTASGSQFPRPAKLPPEKPRLDQTQGKFHPYPAPHHVDALVPTAVGSTVRYATRSRTNKVS